MTLKQLNETPGMGDKQQWDFKEFKKEPEIVDYKTITKHYKTIFMKRHYDRDGGLYMFFWDNYHRWYLGKEVNDDQYIIIGYLQVRDYPHLRNAYQVEVIDVHPKFQKQGLSTFMYRSIQTKTNKKIVSDYIQFEDSRKIWTSLAQKDGVKIYDELTGEKTENIEIKDFNDPSVWGPKLVKKLLLFESPGLKFLRE